MEILGGRVMFACAEGKSSTDRAASCCFAELGGLLRGVGPLGV